MFRNQERALLAAVIIIAVVLTGGCRRAPPEQPPRRPNILFILLDDLRADTLGYAGHPHVKTPHIDRLAKEGVNFKNAFCTTSLCSPSRASILSGLYAHKHGVPNNFTEFPADAAQLSARCCSEAGYETAYIGKWHMGEENDEPRPGFDYFVTHKGQGKYFDTEFNVDGERRKVSAGLLHARRHRHGARLAAARSRRQAVPADARPQGAAQLLHAGAEVRARLRRREGAVSGDARSSSTTSRRGSRTGSTRGTASTARCSTAARSFPTTARRR